jgi:hypothetical protein
MLGYPKFGFQLSLERAPRAGTQSAGYSPNHADHDADETRPLPFPFIVWGHSVSQSVSQAVSSNTSILDWFVDEATTARAL